MLECHSLKESLEAASQWLFTYVDVFLIRGVSQISVHLSVDEAILMPARPHLRLRAQCARHEELLVALQLLVNRASTLESSVLH